MAIKRSAGQEIQALIAELNTQDEVRRESAIARLAVIGTRAVDRLVTLLTEPAPQLAVASALHALESIGDARALPPALSLIDSPDPAVAAAAIGVARRFLDESPENEALDRLVQVALDPSRPEPSRLAALDALNEVGIRVLKPVWERLREDPNIAVRQRAAKAMGQVDPLMEVEAAASGALPESAAALERLIETTASAVPLSTLHKLVEVLRAREGKERSHERQEAWRSVRGAVHAALAVRHSRVALYDLRESFEKADRPLPRSFVTALAAIGDRSALEAAAAAYAATMHSPENDWLAPLRDGFMAIAERENLSGRHAVVRRIESKWPDAARELTSRLRRQNRN